MSSVAAQSSAELLSGRRVLIVEDEMLIAFTLSDMVAGLGCTSQVAGRVAQALLLATTQTFDVAVLDVNLAGESGYAVADALALRGVPFVIATGYGPEGIEAPYRHHPLLSKPYLPRQVEMALLNALRPVATA